MIIYLHPDEYSPLRDAETNEPLSQQFPYGIWAEMDEDGNVVGVWREAIKPEGAPNEVVEHPLGGRNGLK